MEGKRRGTAAWVTPDELELWVAEERELKLVDVRNAPHFEREHIPGAANLPDSNTSALVRGISRDGLTILTCDDGRISQQVARTLDFCGFQNVAYLEGGLRAWVAGGRAVAGRADTPPPEMPRASALDDDTTATIRRLQGACVSLNPRVVFTAILGAAAIVTLVLLLGVH